MASVARKRVEAGQKRHLHDFGQREYFLGIGKSGVGNLDTGDALVNEADRDQEAGIEAHARVIASTSSLLNPASAAAGRCCIR
jgi:hypothetical protein